MGTPTPESESKLVGDDLLQLARSGSEEVVSVLLELDLPRRKVVVEGDRTGGHRRIGWTDEEGVDVETVLQEASNRIQSLTGRSVVELRSARALAAQLSGAELAEVAEMPAIRAIRLNTRLATPRRPFFTAR